MACGSFDWHGYTNLTESGDYTDVLTNAAGCDSTVTLHLTINVPTEGDTTAVACGSFDWHGYANLTESGDYTDVLTNAAGCDSTVTLHLTVYQPVTELVEVTACEGDLPYHYENGDIDTTFDIGTQNLSVFSFQFSTQYGCDSIVTLHLTIYHGEYAEVSVDTCGTEYYWSLADTTVSQSGTYYHYSANANSCTDTAVLMLALYQSVTTELTAQICEGEVYDLNGFNASTAGDHQLNLQTAHGCDSVVILHLTVGSEAVTQMAASICEGESYNENGFEITAPAAGVYEYSDTIGRPGTCDSIVVLTLTVNQPTEGDTTAVACGSFDWHGYTNLTESGDYTDVLTNAAGCDSTVTLHLTINVPTEGDTTVVACDSYDWHGTTYTQSGNYTHTLTNAVGCDSVVTLHLTVNHTTYGDTTAIACNSFDWYEQTGLTVSGDYTHTLTNAAGCDSTVTLHLTINMPTEGDTTAVACGSFNWHGYTNLTESGDYTDVLTNAAGCDSTVTLHLTINVPTEGDTTAVACGSFDWHGYTNLTESGDYTEVLTNTAGCDSTVTLHLTVYQPVTELVEVTACEGDLPYHYVNGDIDTTFDIGTQNLSVFNFQFSTQYGCDSIVTLHLTINHGEYVEVTVDTCGTEFFWAVSGQSYDHSDTYYYYIDNANACQDTTALILTLHQAAITELTAQICEGDIYSQHGFNVSEAGSYQQHLQTVFGCDSTVILHLAVDNETITNIAASICEGEDYVDNGFEIIAPVAGLREYSDTIHRQGTCDSIVILTLMVNQATYGDTSAIACNSFDWYEQTGLTVSGDYTHTLTNAAGCDSIVTLHLTVNHTTYGDTIAIACNGFDWYGNTYTQSGDYTHMLTNMAGCDSVVTLHLTVYPSVTELVEVTACEGDLPYHYVNGDIDTTFDIGTPNLSVFNFQFSTPYGCDSTVTLHLTVNEAPLTSAISGAPVICLNQFAAYDYDISDDSYLYRWYKNNLLWAENVPTVMLHEQNSGPMVLMMQVEDLLSSCTADTSLIVQILDHYAPDTTLIRRKGSTNILICQPVTSEHGIVHYRWGYTRKSTLQETVLNNDFNYCMFNIGIDTALYDYWVDTYIEDSYGYNCTNRSYYGHSIITSIDDYDDNSVEARITDNQMLLSIHSVNNRPIRIELYDMNGRILLTKDYGATQQVTDAINVSIATGIYLLKVNIGNQLYPVKLLKF